MEISPITGIRALPSIKAPAAVPELRGIFEVEYSARTGDETYSSSGGKSERGLEDEEDDLEDGSEAELKVHALEQGVGRQISYFA